MKVLHLIPNLEIGGAEIVLAQLASGLKEHGIESRILALSPGGSLTAEIEQQGTAVHELSPGTRALIPMKLWRYVRSYRDVWSPDIIQGWMYHANLAALLAKRGFGERPRVAWNIRMAHTQLDRDKKSTAAVVKMGARLSRSPEAIIYNSQNSASVHEQQLGYSSANRHVIPNGFDTSKWVPSEEARSALRAELRVPSEALLVGLIARYHPFKNHAGFLSAAARIHRKMPHVEFVLVGPNVDENNEELVTRIRLIDLQQSIHLLGARRDLPRIAAALDLVVSASYMEGFPNVIGEAMSCGIPCVVTAVGDSALLIGEAGRVIPAGDEAALAGACVELLSLDRDQRMLLGAAGRQRIQQKFSLQSTTSTYAKLYAHMLAQSRNESS